MSHFVVMVTGDDVEGALAPFHEFQYVQNVDKTESARKEYETATRRCLVSASGERAGAHEDRFYRDPTPEEAPHMGFGVGCANGISFQSKDWGDGRGYRPKVRFVPDGWTEVSVPMSDLKSFAEFAGREGVPIVSDGAIPDTSGAHKHGWVRVNAEGQVIEVIDRTNPNAKWDWWVTGGRFGGMLPLRSGEWVDSGLWGDVDMEAAREKKRAEAVELYSRWSKMVKAHGRAQPWSHFCESHDAIEEARAAYRRQPLIAAADRDSDMRWMCGCPVDEFGYDGDAYIARRVATALVPFAVLHEGRWIERGEMGWFACVSNEKPVDEWHAQVRAFYDSLAPDTRVTAVDCHI